MEKLTPEELEQITKLTQQFQQTLFELGGIEKNIADFNKQLKKLNEEKQTLLIDLDKIDAKEIEMANILREKYGEGTIDPQTGDIKPL